MNVIATIRKDKQDRKGLAPIYIHIYEGEKLIARRSIGHKIDVKHWDDTTRTVKGTPLATLVNALIAKEVTKTSELIFAAKLQGEDVRANLRRNKARDLPLDTYIARIMESRPMSAETRRNYNIYHAKLKAYAPGLTIRGVTAAFLASYEQHLKSVARNAHNTIASNMKFIDVVMNAAKREGLIDESPFRVYKRPRYKQTPRVYLTGEEVARIESEADTFDGSTRRVALYFLLMCYTGLRFSDAVRFNAEEHIREGRIVMNTKKTGKATQLLINDKIGALLRKIADQRVNISQVEFNRKLKVIAAACGIRKNLSSHVARHTFGAALVDLEVPIEVAKELLTHGSTKVTAIYYHMKNKNLDDAMKRFDKKKPG